MVIGIIGLGVVGGVLKRWFDEHTEHEIRVLDSGKGLADSFDGVDAAFICIPVPASSGGQDLGGLTEAIRFAKNYTADVFIRSTVLPGTCDSFGVTAMPEFLTERTAYADMERLPVVVGGSFGPASRDCINETVEHLFPGKEIIQMTNVEAEITKYAHNCFGAMKVTYFNMVHELCEAYGANYDEVKEACFMTGFIERMHTQVPGPDMHFGYGGKCFPENIESLKRSLPRLGLMEEYRFLEAISELNEKYRKQAL